MTHKALVFISCGQRSGERELATEIEQLIKSDEFGFDCYNADSRQGFDDVMSITENLSKADYYLFIDFKREGDFPISVFTHQEFALARAWGITEIIAFREKGALKRGIGMVGSVLAHPIEFERENLIQLVKVNIKSRKWHSGYSRNLVASKIVPPSRAVRYLDTIENKDHQERIWQIIIENHRNDRAALNAVVILDDITDSAGNSYRPDTTYLKWARIQAYQRIIFPHDSANFDAFCIRLEEEGVFLHSTSDVIPRKPIIETPGSYILKYLLYADSFPPVRFKIELNYQRSAHYFEVNLVT